jgi:diketogulonate reductase-like aldo/keto reductase
MGAPTASQVTLNNGMKMPLVGFGTAGLERDTKQAVKWALEAGYRLLDSAQVRSGHPSTATMFI